MNTAKKIALFKLQAYFIIFLFILCSCFSLIYLKIESVPLILIFAILIYSLASASIVNYFLFDRIMIAIHDDSKSKINKYLSYRWFIIILFGFFIPLTVLFFSVLLSLFKYPEMFKTKSSLLVCISTVIFSVSKLNEAGRISYFNNHYYILFRSRITTIVSFSSKGNYLILNLQPYKSDKIVEVKVLFKKDGNMQELAKIDFVSNGLPTDDIT